jgi:tetratricopeptide (TPR) repeat protein
MNRANESAIAAVSLSCVAVLACSIVLLAGAPGIRGLMWNIHLGPHRALEQRDSSASPGGSIPRPTVENSLDSAASLPPTPLDPRMREIQERFQQAVMMLHAGRYDDAATALHRVILLSPRLAEAYVNMGYAMMGLERYAAARDFFLAATDLKPYQANAYYGLATALEQLNDLEGALGAMRTFIHLSPPDDPFVRKARSAIWEWDTQLARGPLPEQEQQWIRERTKQWEDRNSPDRDAPDTGGRTIPVRKVQ